jgi:tetratricopeptide (TPR) repeat protein
MADHPHAPDAELTPAAAFELAIARYQAGAYGEAARLFATIPPSAPDSPVAMRLHGLALVRCGRVDEGLPLLAQARRLASHEPLSHLHYGIGLHAARRFEEAAVFRACCNLMPGNAAPLLNLAAALLELGDTGASRDAARQAVMLEPKSAEAHYTLGLAESAAHDASVAREAFAAAVGIDPKFADAWIGLGRAKYQLGDVAGATQAMASALRLKPDHGIAEANLAVFMGLRGDQTAAMARLRAILQRDPACMPARINLATQLILDREPAEALDVLSAAPPPGPAGVHWRAQRAGALLMLHRNAEARAELDAITEPQGDAEILIAWRRIVLALRAGDRAAAEGLAARTSELAGSETAALLEHRIIAHFDLARYRYRNGERERAFDHWQQGHALLARTQPFSRPRHAEFVAASIAAYDRARLSDGPRAENEDAAPIFIVGMPRSGTTLTEQILAAHPSVYGAGERTAVRDTLTRLAGASLDAASVAKAASLEGGTLDEAGRAHLHALHALAPDARYVIDKMPGNALHLGFIATILPHARVIYCVRDPRDIGLSIFQRRFYGYHPYAHDLGDLGWYIGQHMRLMEHWRAVLPLPVLTVDLADWINDFPATLRTVLAFLDLPYAAACEDFYLQRRKVRTSSRDQVRQPITARGLGRWREFAHRLAPLIEELARADALPSGGHQPNLLRQ